MGDELRVDPDALTDAGGAFREAGTALAQQKDTAASDASGCGADLVGAAAKYRGTDAAAATAVAGSMPGS
jgi:hypothetical protein